MKKIYTLLLALMITSLGFTQTTVTIDFETADDGYTASGSAGSGFTDVFNRTNPNIGGNSTFIWAVEDMTLTDPTIDLDQIDVTGATEFTFSLDMLAHHFEDWDSTDELLITYSTNNGVSYQNLMWVQMSQGTGDNFNGPAALDLAFDNDGDCGASTTLPALTTGTQHGCTVSASNFANFSTSAIPLSGVTTLDIKLQFNNLDGTDEGIYLDNIVIDHDGGSTCTAPSTQASAYNTTSLGSTSATLNWTSGDGDEVLVLVKEGSAVDTDPTNGTSYTGNTAFGSGTEIGTGNYAVYAGTTASSVSITSLTAGTTYHVAVYEYNTLDTCYLTPALTGSFTTDCTVPTDVSTFTATAGNTEVDLSWTNGSCFDEILVVARETSAVSVTPSGDGTAYTANATFGSGTDLGTSEYAVYKGTGTSVTVTGLTNGTTYHFTAFARKITTWSAGASDNTTPASTPVAGDIVISEIMYNTPSTDDEWIEIYNGSGADITLNSDWRLTYGSNTYDFTGTLITDGEYLTIALGSNGDGTYNNDNPFTPDISAIATPVATTNDTNNIGNSSATIAIIYDPSGFNVTIDTVTYDDGSPWPTTPDGNGPSLELIDVTSDNSLAASWDASDDDGGTPGSARPVVYTFTGTWSPSDPNGTALAADNIIVASGNATIDTNTTCNSVTVNAGAGLTVDTGITLTTSNGVTLESTSITYSSLILDGTIAGTGAITYERHVNINGSGETGSNDLISAPLTGQAFNLFEDANPNILSDDEVDPTFHLFGPFDKTTGDYLIYADGETATLDPGIGYRTASNDNGTFTFTGTANNGEISVNITNGGPTEPEWNLVGNPYPSYINVQDFLNHDVDDTAATVTNLQLFNAGTAAIYGYDGTALDGWVTYNLASTTASTLIAPGQGFFVSADATNVPLYDLEFTPAMRSNGTTDDFIAGRQAQLVFVKVNASTNDKSSTTDFYFNNNASQGFDLGYDAEVWGETLPEFVVYSHLVENNQGDAMALQALNPNDISDITIPLGVNANQGEQLTFSISETTLPESTNVYLDDVVANTSTLLNNNDYVITPTTNLSGTGRFFLRTSQETLTTIENSLDALNIFALTNSKELVVSGQLQENSNLELYDIQGRKVLSTQLDYTNIENRIDVSNFSGGIYLVTVENNGKQKTQKIVLK